VLQYAGYSVGAVVDELGTDEAPVVCGPGEERRGRQGIPGLATPVVEETEDTPFLVDDVRRRITK
jgi:hypothetical protein